MSHRKKFMHPFPERGTKEFTGTLRDEASVVVPLSRVDAMTLTLYDERTRTIINSRDGQNIRNTNGGSIHASSGAWTLRLDDLDMIIVDPNLKHEVHVALIEWTFDTIKTGKQEIEFRVENLTRVP